MRIDAITVDASCLAKLFLDEADSPQFRSWYAGLQASGMPFEAPHLLQYELGNILNREFSDLPATERGAMLGAALQAIRMGEVPPEDPFRVPGALTYYDASYIAAARPTASLATDDEQMAKAYWRHQPTGLCWNKAARAAALDAGFSDFLAREAPRAAKAIAFDSGAPHTFIDAWSAADQLQAPDWVGEAIAQAFARFAAS